MLRGLKEIMEASVAYGKLATLKEMIVNHGLTSLQRFDLLKLALEKHKEQIAEFLLESDCKEDSCKQYVQPGQKTLLHLACENWCDSVAAVCIRQGDDVNCRDSRQRTPLFYCKSTATAKLLLQNGALIDARDEEGKTPLHCCHYTFTASLLLDNGAPVDIRDNSGLTPLISMLCSGGYYVRHIRNLLVLIDECGVEPDQCNEYMHLQKWFSKVSDNAFGILSWHAGKARASCGSHQSDKVPFSARLILESGQVNRRDESGNSPLHYCENVAVAQLLLAKGAQVDVKNRRNQTPLHCCTDVEVARLLLNQGAPIDAGDSSGLTPLMRMLCNKRDVASIRRCFGLINELGVTFDQSEQFKLLVEWARGDQDDEGFRELLKHGIDAQVRSGSGQTVLHYVVDNKLDISIVGQLRRFVDANAVDSRGYSLVHTLLDNYNQRLEGIPVENWESFDYHAGRAFDAVYDELKILLEENPDIDLNVRNSNSDTPLHMAIHTGRGKFVDLLLERGADPNIQDGFARTPLILAVRFLRYDHPERHIKHLLDHGAHMFFEVPNGDTVFDYGDRQFLMDYVLTNSGRSLIDKVDREGNTALHYICKSCQIDLIRRIDLGSLDLNVVNNSGETPLQLASKAGRARTVGLLIGWGAGDSIDGRTFDGLTRLHVASVQESIGESDFAEIIASHLEQCGLDIDARDKVGKTPLHYAIDNQSVFRVKLLLEKGADANAVDHMGRNSLYRAIECRKLDIVELILNDRKVDASRCFADGKTPLHLVAAWDRPRFGHLSRAIKLLLEHDVDVDQLDATGNTPLFASMCSDGTIKPWLDFGANLDQLYWIDKHSGLRLAKKYDTHTYELLSIRLHEARLVDRVDCNDHYQDDNMSDYTRKCQDEVGRVLKRRKLIGQMSHYEFLHNADPSIAMAVSDSSYDINSLAVDFPIYGNLIKGKIKMDLFRNNLMPSASHKLHWYLIRSPNLSRFSIPPEIAWRILIHLSKNELIKFVGLSQHR